MRAAACVVACVARAAGDHGEIDRRQAMDHRQSVERGTAVGMDGAPDTGRAIVTE